MRNRLAIFILVATVTALVASVASSVSAENELTIDAISFKASGKGASPSVNTLTPVKGGVVGRYDVVASITHRQGPYDDFFLLASVEAVVAPQVLPAELLGQDVTTAVGWGYISTMDTLRAQVIRHIAPSEQVLRTVTVLDVDNILRKSFSDPDETLWPWAFRVTVYIVDRYGKPVSHNSGVLRLNPPVKQRGGLLPNNPISPAVVPVTRLACARRAPITPAGIVCVSRQDGQVI